MDLDHWREVAQSIWRHKTRTLLTAFGVFWGIFMLVALLGSGNAMKNGAMGMFKDDAVNSVFVYGNRTSKAYMGLKPGRRIQFTLDHLEALKRSVPGIEIITPRKRVDYDTRINFGPEQGTFDVRGVFPNYAFIEKTIVTQGRYLNDKDLNERRRVALVGTEIINVLFTNSADPRIRKLNPIGQYIQIAGVPFKIIGVFKDIGGDSELRRIFLPVTTVNEVFDPSPYFRNIALTTREGYRWEDVRADILTQLSKMRRFDPEDTSALYIRANIEEFERVQSLYKGINVFIYIVGLGTLFAGIVGVSNVMLVTVKERRKEIGVRKAIGATPFTILSMILKEALLITSVAGYSGLMAGVAALSIVRNSGLESDFFQNPSVDLSIAGLACLVIVGAGVAAGYLPAKLAVSIKPIEALRYE